MVVDTSGEWWTGTETSDVDEFVVELVESNDGYVPTRFIHATCSACSGHVFRVVSDPEQYVQRTCVACGEAVEMLGSREIPEDEREVQPITCPCGHDGLELAVGIAPGLDPDHATWVFVGFRCTADGVLSMFADWKENSPIQDLALQA